MGGDDLPPDVNLLITFFLSFGVWGKRVGCRKHCTGTDAQELGELPAELRRRSPIAETVSPQRTGRLAKGFGIVFHRWRADLDGSANEICERCHVSRNM